MAIHPMDVKHRLAEIETDNADGHVDRYGRGDRRPVLARSVRGAVHPTMTTFAMAPLLFAALNVLDSTVIGRCMQRHRHQGFLRFLNAVEAAVQGRARHPRQVRGWLARHPRWTFHYTPTSGS
jgi:hypothetical protein